LSQKLLLQDLTPCMGLNASHTEYKGPGPKHVVQTLTA